MTSNNMSTGATTNSSPPSKAGGASSDSERIAPDVVDVTAGGATGGDEPWTASSARQTSEPPPIRSSKRASTKPSSAAVETAAVAHKGKKKAVKRRSAGVAETAPPRKSARVSALPSDELEQEDKAPIPAAVHANEGECPAIPGRADRAAATSLRSLRPHAAAEGAAVAATPQHSTGSSAPLTLQSTPAVQLGPAQSAARMTRPPAHRTRFDLERFLATFDPADRVGSTRMSSAPVASDVRTAAPHEDGPTAREDNSAVMAALREENT
ncbi:Serine/threonine-protein kinase Nek2 [Phytophthora cinnamomi]|uniref:Serine/threonine-protein kinase Nek2 n=1 Tax=Phytophthora cinnamomi TaxID=4785 RepID=UPI00355A13E2|nr:Serine/threonine-protein kinase Nek2 [Phytophthora cinnamomi]